MKCCFILDPIEKLKPYKDSSLALMHEAQRRGFEVYAAGFSDASILNGRPELSARRVAMSDGLLSEKTAAAPHYVEHAAEIIPVEAFGAVFIRKDPPFDSDYFSLTLMLDAAAEGATRFVNAPRGLRDVSEKLVATRFAKHAPKTLATYSTERARAFAAAFEGVVLKPSYFGAGEGVEKSAASDPEFDAAFARTLATEPKGPVIVQEFLPEIVDGDCRVMIIAGAVEGAVGRRPADGEFRANIAAGGSEFAVELSPKQSAICAEIGPFLTSRGIFFAGADFIGDRLIEINVTSPTLIHELRRVSGLDMAAVIWNKLLG